MPYGCADPRAPWDTPESAWGATEFTRAMDLVKFLSTGTMTTVNVFVGKEAAFGPAYAALTAAGFKVWKIEWIKGMGASNGVVGHHIKYQSETIL